VTEWCAEALFARDTIRAALSCLIARGEAERTLDRWCHAQVLDGSLNPLYRLMKSIRRMVPGFVFSVRDPSNIEPLKKAQHRRLDRFPYPGLCG
jgi:hypothetical protein